jgi:hypothetical protein
MKTIIIKKGSETKMSDEMKKAVNAAFDGVEESEDEEVESAVNKDIKEVREMINEIEETLEEMDEKELTLPNKDYVDNLKMSLTRFCERDEDEKHEVTSL